MAIAIVVHGGAGAWDRSADRLTDARRACELAASAGLNILMTGGSALDAVEAAVSILEDSPVLDAGRGSYPNARGIIEMDALIMDGQSLALGAIAAVQQIRHPIQLARRVMQDSDHQFFVGTGAEAFADEIGFPRCSAEELMVDHEWSTAQSSTAEAISDSLGDTVGAVALDAEGNLAAATSTGGTAGKQPGRVGDSPLVGSGAYADNRTAAVSATGHGEMLMRVVISKQVCDFVATGFSARAACKSAIELMQERTRGQGGLIAVDAWGQVGWAYNTNGMPGAYATSIEPVTSFT